MKLLSLTLIIFLIIISTGHVLAADQPKTVLAVYMIGSDLEYDPDLSPEDNMIRKSGATKDITEMVSGWGNGSADLGIIIGYGGSKKEGWEGLTVATIDDLKQDLKDGIIGNSEEFYQGWEERDMASSIGIQRFLEYVNKVYPDSRLVLILWDHGAAWEGFGRDANYQDSQMTPADLQTALRNTGSKVDLLGLDACFMANIEFLRIISPYARYAVASEETEPEHGWNYAELVSSLKERPDIPGDELGRKIIDSYLDNPGHQQGALSLSLLNLSQMPKLLTSFDNLASSLAMRISEPGSYRLSSRLAGNLSGIGTGKDYEGNDVEMMVDLVALTEKTGIAFPELQEKSQSFRSVLKDFIVYSRHDSPVTQINGIGIFSPVMASHPIYYGMIKPGTVLDLTSGWTRFITNFAEQIRSDTTHPQLIPESGGYRIIEDGYTFVTDIYYQIRPDKSKVVLAQEPSANLSDEWVSTPEWGGTGSFLTDGTSSSLLPGYYVETNDDGVQLYYAWGILVQGTKKRLVRLDLWFDPATGVLQWIMRPYSFNSEGEQEFERSAATPSAGDLFAIYSLVIDRNGKNRWEEIGRVTWSKQMRIKNFKMPCGEYGLQVMAMDLAGNTGKSDIIPYSIPCP